MREKRYYKDMKGTRGKEEGRNDKVKSSTGTTLRNNKRNTN